MSRPKTQAHIDAPLGVKDSGTAVSAVARLELARKRFHFIGAGGVGMSGLAHLLMENSVLVSGSDQTPTEATDKLRRAGADIQIGHSAEHLNPQTDAIVVSAAIRSDNPELKLARERGVKVYKYAEMLGELMDCYEGIAISGTHGKSTTCGWLAYLLRQAGVDVSFIIGAGVNQLGCSSGVGASRFFIAEACEYDRSFLNLRPRIACILNIEQDHLDYYSDEDEIVEAFADFARGTKRGGVIIANGQDANVARILSDPSLDLARYETFGLDESCNFYAKNVKLRNGLHSFDVYHDGTYLGPAKISVPGVHNIYNALAVVATATHAGLDPDKTLRLLPSFTGMDRRIMLKGQIGDITILDDYAHHPTEIRASLAAIRQRYQPRRIWCIFQPHQYSRTRFLLDDFAESFKLADVTIVPEIYFVRDSESTKREVNAQILVDKMRSNGTQALFIEGFGAICDYLKANVNSGELVVTMGAGDIWKVADGYLQWLGGHS